MHKPCICIFKTDRKNRIKTITILICKVIGKYIKMQIRMEIFRMWRGIEYKQFSCESIFSCLFLFLQLYYIVSFKKQLAIIKIFFIPLLITTKQKPLIDKLEIISNEPKHIATLVRPCILISRA